MAYVLDHAGLVYRHGLPTARRRWSLHGKQQDDAAVERLFRCRECGAVNDRTDEECVHCGAALHRRRPPRVEVAGPRLAEAVEVPVNDTELREMSYRAALRWAAGDDGRLLSARLERIARARGFKAGWVFHHQGRFLQHELAAVEALRRQKLAQSGAQQRV